uniref:Uncharacterized protein n=1 Tax=Anopheles christyi TaxID=43041 RepID=A0A182K0Y8_9DIPT
MAQDHHPSSCYTSATDTSIVRTNPALLITATQLEGSFATLPIAADSGNNSEASTASSTHPLATTTNSNAQPVAQSLLTIAGVGYGSIADDVSDSADSEYRSLEANDQEDSDSAVAPLPQTQDENSSDH